VKMNWTVTGVIVYRDGRRENVSDVWPRLGMDEATARADELVASSMRRRDVAGVSLTAAARGKGGTSLITLARGK
jgi:hypothetical protein